VARLEVLTRGAAIRGILPDGLVTVVDVLFDPFLAVHTSLIEPLPHQIAAVAEVTPNAEFPKGNTFAVRAARAPNGAPAGRVVRYVPHPFVREPDLGATSINRDWRELWVRAVEPG
jgi:hypothetical protein